MSSSSYLVSLFSTERFNACAKQHLYFSDISRDFFLSACVIMTTQLAVGTLLLLLLLLKLYKATEVNSLYRVQ